MTRYGKYGLIWAITFLPFSCSKGPEEAEFADVGIYFFYFNDEVKTEESRWLVNHLTKSFQKYDYIMSNESAEAGWPYFGEIKKGEKIPQTEILPPHKFLHRLIPFDRYETDNSLNYYFKIKYSILNYGKQLIIKAETFERRSGQWILISSPPLSKINVKKYKSKLSLSNDVNKTLIRDTFK